MADSTAPSGTPPEPQQRARPWPPTAHGRGFLLRPDASEAEIEAAVLWLNHGILPPAPDGDNKGNLAHVCSRFLRYTE